MTAIPGHTGTDVDATVPIPRAPLPVETIRARAPRLLGVDATRGVALLGMMAIHALYPMDAQGNPTLIYSVAAGRAAAVFAVLAGVGIAFLTGRRRVRLGRPARRTLRVMSTRAAVIGAIGLSLGFADSDTAMVILPYYAVLFLIAVPLVLLPTPALVGVGMAVAVGMPFLSEAVRAGLPLPSGLNHSFADLFTDPVGMLQELLLTGEFPVLPWTTYLCAGLVVGRLRLQSSRTATTLLGVGTAVAVVALALSAWLLGPLGGLARIEAAGTGDEVPTAEILAFGADGTTPTTTSWWLAVATPHTGTPFDLVHTTGTSVALLGAMLLLGHVTAPGVRRVLDLALRPLAAAGSMTLTLYAAHIAFMSSPLDVFGPMSGYLVQVAAVVLFALVWRKAVGRGPLESVVTWAAARVAGDGTDERSRKDERPRTDGPTGSGRHAAGRTVAGPPPRVPAPDHGERSRVGGRRTDQP